MMKLIRFGGLEKKLIITGEIIGTKEQTFKGIISTKVYIENIDNIENSYSNAISSEYYIIFPSS